MAVIVIVAMVSSMSPQPSNRSGSADEDQLADLLRAHGWKVEREAALASVRPDLIAHKGSLHYAIELKHEAEGRPDRVLALLSQAILQASRYAQLLRMAPLAVVHVGQASESLYRKVENFHHQYAPDVAIGLVSGAGGGRFVGVGLGPLNSDPPSNVRNSNFARPRAASELFSDLNQWMLKVLLAPELPENLLGAPRGEYRSGSEVAEAAQVSAMSASRFVRRFQEEGFLESSSRSLRLVRRRELFRRWQSWAMKSSPELPMAFLIPGGGKLQLHKAVAKMGACIGLFTAADLLGVGHVSGVPPYIYVRKLSPYSSEKWPGLVPSRLAELPQVIVKQSSCPESLFRGAVRIDDVLVCDVLQLWLDVSAHPSRGMEQADYLRRKVLHSVLGNAE